MGTIADKLQLLLGTKGDIRQAITAMGQSVAETLPFSGYAAKIRAISSDATAAAGDILSGKTAYAGGKKITGTIASKGAADLTASGATVSVPAGYYPSAVSKSVAAATQATPSITVDSAGKITASATQTAGYVSAGTKSATQQLTTQGAATITPGTAAKTAVAAGRYTTGAVQVAGDANLLAENIKKDVSIFGVTGSLESGEAETVIISVSNSSGRTVDFWVLAPSLNMALDGSPNGSWAVASLDYYRMPAGASKSGQFAIPKNSFVAIPKVHDADIGTKAYHVVMGNVHYLASSTDPKPTASYSDDSSNPIQPRKPAPDQSPPSFLSGDYTLYYVTENMSLYLQIVEV